MTMDDARHFVDLAPSATKRSIKALLRRRPRAYKLVEALYENSLYVPHIASHGLIDLAIGRRHGRGAPLFRQPVLTWDVPFPRLTTARQLIAWMHSQGVQVFEGGHTFYIPPQRAIRTILPGVTAFYPSGCGFKVLKDFRHPLHAKYLYKHRRSLKVLMRLIGTPHDQLIPANYMHALGIGPRVWDLTCWSTGESYCSVFVVEHVAGRRPTTDESVAFLRHLECLTVESRLRVLIPAWQSNDDFKPPTCNGNLVHSEALSRVQYLDFQNFGLTARRGAKEQREGDDDRSATVPRRQPAEYGHDPALLGQQGTGGGRIVLEPACRSASTITAPLAAGAAWVHGWCDSERMRTIEESLFLSGATRFTLHIGTDRSR
jgi:hypothetical protein